MGARRIAATTALLVAVACTSGAEEPVSTHQTDTTPRGGTLRVAVPDLFVANDAYAFDLDPQRGYFGGVFELGRCCLFRTLYSYNGRPTEQGGTELHPDLAAGNPQVSSDGLTWTFKLKPGLRYAPPFEDTTITSLDLVRALERTAGVTSPPAGYGFYYEVIRGFGEYGSGEADSIVGLETPDDRTLVVRLEQVTGDLAYRFSLPATSPIPEGAADGHGKDYARFLVASGPYMVEGSEALDPSAPPLEQEPAAGMSRRSSPRTWPSRSRARSRWSGTPPGSLGPTAYDPPMPTGSRSLWAGPTTPRSPGRWTRERWISPSSLPHRSSRSLATRRIRRSRIACSAIRRTASSR